MIQLTRFNGTRLYLNAEMIQIVEDTPDTVITLTNSVKIVVKEPSRAVIEKIIHYQRMVHNPQLNLDLGD